MHQLETFSPRALQPFVSFLVQRGIPAKRYLQNHHIPVELINTGEGKIFKRQAYGFFRDVAEKEGLAGFGFLDGDSYSIGDLGMLGQATLRASTLKDSLLTFAGLLATVAEGNYVWLDEGSEFSWIYCKTFALGRTDYVPDHTSVLVLRELIRLVTGTDWQPSRVHLYTEPVREIERMSGFTDTQIEFFQNQTGLAFPTELLIRPLRYDGNLTSVTDANKDLKSLPQTTHDKLYSVLWGLYSNQCHITVEQVTEILGISRSTLHRSLAKEGTNSGTVLERVRYKRAIELLNNTTESIGEIARLLGYSTNGNFTRAFHRMSGFTPTEYRKRRSKNMLVFL